MSEQPDTFPGRPFGPLLPESFFARPTERVARELLGKVLVTRIDDAVTAGMIVETEAYLGANDPGSHASTKGITARNSVMFGPPAHAYVYFTYGNHHMLNLVAEDENTAGAVLVRAVEPLAGESVMAARRGGRFGVELTNGPGKVAQAFGVDLRHNGLLLGEAIALHEGDAAYRPQTGTSGRVGLRQGHELELRFYIVGNEYVSRGRTGPKPPRRWAKEIG